MPDLSLSLYNIAEALICTWQGSESSTFHEIPVRKVICITQVGSASIPEKGHQPNRNNGTFQHGTERCSTEATHLTKEFTKRTLPRTVWASDLLSLLSEFFFRCRQRNAHRVTVVAWHTEKQRSTLRQVVRASF
mmetsp:Transcript_51386/g.122112  ORF Transcript_51386/g.122112 Transcript_51386/m.122112 type:complete len:134 (+) Transcript_51386:17-418(+)